MYWACKKRQKVDDERDILELCRLAKENFQDLINIYEVQCVFHHDTEDRCKNWWFRLNFLSGEPKIVKKTLSPYIKDIIKEKWDIEYTKFKYSHKFYGKQLESIEGFSRMKDNFIELRSQNNYKTSFISIDIQDVNYLINNSCKVAGRHLGQSASRHPIYKKECM